MKEDVEKLLDSDLLERYLMEDTSEEETKKVIYYVDTYPEVKTHFDELQDNLERYARSFAKKPPVELKERIMDKVSATSPATTHRRIRWYAIAASIAALLFAGYSIFLRQSNSELIKENQLVMQEIEALKQEYNTTFGKLASVRSELDKLRNPETQKYVLRGNQRAKDLKTVAYINPVEKVSMINVVDLPELPEDKVFQMWADVNGEMISLGILEKAENRLLRVPYQEDASSYNITIEPKGGNKHATVENLVANVAFEEE